MNFRAGSSTCARYTTEDNTRGAKLTVLVASTPNVTGTNIICLGKSTTLTANNCDGTITWSSGQSTLSITVLPISTTTYSVTCTSVQCGFSVTSEPYSVVVNSISPPEGITYDVITPQTLVFAAKTTIPNATLLWYNKATGGVSTSTAPFFTAVGTYSYWVTQTDPITGCESARVPQIAKVLNYFQIVAQPATQADCKGNSVYMNVTAVSPNSTFTYQWQRKRPNEADFTNLIEDENGIRGWYSKTMVVSNIGDNDNPHLSQYRCIVSSGGQNLFSEPAPLSVNSVIGVLPNLGVCVGGETDFYLPRNFSITGNVLSYQWQTRPGTSGTWTNLSDRNNITGTSTDRLKFTNVGYDKEQYYRCLVKFNTQNFECTEPTDPAKLIISGYPSAPLVSNVNYCQYAKASKMKVDSKTQNMIWYKQETGGTGSEIAPTPTTDVAGTFSYYVADRTDQGCESPRTAIKIEIGAIPPAPINTTPSSVNEGEVLTFSAEGTSTENQVFRWYNSPTGTTFSTTAPTFTADGTYTRYVAQLSAFGCLGSRTAITASITPNLKFTKQPISQADCDGNSVTFSVTATGQNEFSYQWQRLLPNEIIFVDLRNQTTNSLKISNLGDVESPNLTKYRCIITDKNGKTISQESVLIVNEIKGTFVNKSICDGKATNLTFEGLTFTGEIFSYQWQKKDGNSYLDIPTNSKGVANTNEIGTYRGKVTFIIDNKNTCVRYTDNLQVQIKPTPIAPKVIDNAVCLGTNILPEKTVIATNTLLWYDAVSDATAEKNAPKIDLTKVGKNVFYVNQITEFGCESERKTFTIEILPVPTKPIVKDINYCRNSPSIALEASTEKENQLLWYESLTAKTAFANTPIPSSKTDGITNYFVGSKNIVGCESERVPMKVSVTPCIATFENNFNNCLQVAADSVKGNKWYDLYDNLGRLYASVNPNGLNLGKVSIFIRHYGRGSFAMPATQNSTSFMARYIDFQSSLLDKFPNSVSIKIYYLNEEFQEYKTAINLPNLTINDFNIVHYDGIKEDCDFKNNENFIAGNSVVIYKNVVGTQIAKDFFYLQFDVNEFSENGATVNDFTEASFTGKETESKTVQLNWQTKFEIKAEKFILQRSVDCKTWATLGEIKANGISSNYQQLDPQPLRGKSCYRLIYIDKDGTKKYLDPIEVNFSDVAPVCDVFPNPWTKGDVINLYLRNIKEKDIKLYDLLGRETSIDWEKDDFGIIKIRPKDFLLLGTHFVIVIDENGKRCLQKVVINP